MSDLLFWRLVLAAGELTALAYAAIIITVVTWRRARRG